MLNSDLQSPALDAFEITPSDSEDLPVRARGVYVGEAGDLSVVMNGGNTVTFRNVPAGSLIPIVVRRVLETTTATSLLGMM